jgi:hypothetical protein
MRPVLLGLVFALGCSHDSTMVEQQPFSCGSLTCDTATQSCSIVMPPLPNGQPSYACVTADGGVPSCDGKSIATGPGMCGCYVSPTGAVTDTACPP